MEIIKAQTILADLKRLPLSPLSPSQSSPSEPLSLPPSLRSPSAEEDSNLNWNSKRKLSMERTSTPQFRATQMPVPKGRGRPRASYAQTGEFDLGLIREYQSRPALYDRSNKRFKDKMHSAQLWLQIAHKLGYDVNILRERMITLRNRYNIEKRRLENCAMTSTVLGSQWPLFDNLSFLSEHIRSRRSYKTQSKSIEDDDDEPYDGVDDSQSNDHMKSIKHEIDSSVEEVNDDDDCDQQLPVTTVLSIPMSMQHEQELNGGHMHHMANGTNMDAMCNRPSMAVPVGKQKRDQYQFHDADQPESKRRREYLSNPSGASGLNLQKSSGIPAKASTTAEAVAAAATATTSLTYPKFRAFGEFLSHSLNELSHSVAMRLVEQFTQELVYATIANEQTEQQHQRKGNHASSSSVANKQQTQASPEPSSQDELDD